MPSVVYADSYIAPLPGFVADDAQHEFCKHSSIAPSEHVRFDQAMQHMDLKTDLYDVDLGTSCPAGTDIVFIYNSAWPALGETICVVWLNIFQCDVFWVIINPADHVNTWVYCGGPLSNLDFNWHITIRHEIGHTLGLWHVQPTGTICSPPNPAAIDAMVSDWVIKPYETLSYLDYSAHHVNHINGQF